MVRRWDHNNVRAISIPSFLSPTFPPAPCEYSRSDTIRLGKQMRVEFGEGNEGISKVQVTAMEGKDRNDEMNITCCREESQNVKL